MFDTNLKSGNYEYTPEIVDSNTQNTANGLYGIRGGKSSRIIEGVFSKVNKITGTKVLNPIAPEKGKKVNNILELGPGAGQSFDKFLDKIGTDFDNLILIEGNENSIKIFKEKLQNKKYEKIRHKIHFIHADLSTKEGLKIIAGELSKLNIKNIDIIFAKAFIHHLFTQEQKQLFEFLKNYMDDDSFVFLYNQFIPKDINILKDDLVITKVLNIVTNYFIKLENIYIKKGLKEAKKETSYIQKEALKKLGLGLLDVIIKKVKSKFFSFDISKYSEDLFGKFLDKLETEVKVHNLEDTIKRFFSLYAKLFTSEINKKEHSKYNIQTIEHITQIFKECGFNIEIFDGSLWSKGIKAKKIN